VAVSAVTVPKARWTAVSAGVKDAVRDRRAVHKHIRSIFAKLDLAPTDQVVRRVAAVLHYLEDARRRS
jgi:hypothetical protein